MAAPKGNKNAAKGKQFQDALRRALNADGREGLKNIATKLVDAAEAGEGWAIKEVADRLDGKSQQAVDLSGELDVNHNESGRISEHVADAIERLGRGRQEAGTSTSLPH